MALGLASLASLISLFDCLFDLLIKGALVFAALGIADHERATAAQELRVSMRLGITLGKLDAVL